MSSEKQVRSNLVMKKIHWFLLILLLPFHVVADEAKIRKASLADLIHAAEAEFYQVERPDRFSRQAALLNVMETLYPKEPYVWWAKARAAFFQKEEYYQVDKDNELLPLKEALGEICHNHVDRCIKLAPENAECWLMKGSCYAMQASTWGASFKSLRICNSMDRAFAKAMTLPSTFAHPEGTTTRQLSQILRGVLHRIIPDSFWFRFVSGVRGSKERAYFWLEEAVTGLIAREPMVVTEKAVAAICYGRQINRPDLEKKGLAQIREGLKLPIRYMMDQYDHRNMKILLEHPERACNYSREAFRDFSEEKLKKKKKKKKD